MGALDQPEALAQAVQTLLQHSQAEAMLVTRGKEGLSLFQPPQASVHIAARARDVFDVTGAGDTVTATFAVALLSGYSMVEAARVANVAAGVVVGKLGTAVVCRRNCALPCGKSLFQAAGKLCRVRAWPWWCRHIGSVESASCLLMAVLTCCMLVIFTIPACACTRGALDRRAQR